MNQETESGNGSDKVRKPVGPSQETGGVVSRKQTRSGFHESGKGPDTTQRQQPRISTSLWFTNCVQPLFNKLPALSVGACLFHGVSARLTVPAQRCTEFREVAVGESVLKLGGATARHVEIIRVHTLRRNIYMYIYIYMYT